MSRLTLLPCLLLVLLPLRLVAAEVVELAVPAGSREEVWSRALAVAWEGREAVAVPYGIADVVTDELAVEVDRLSSWHGAIGQAIHYSYALRLRPCVALIDDGTLDPAKLRYIEKICKRRRIVFVLLVAPVQ